MQVVETSTLSFKLAAAASAAADAVVAAPSRPQLLMTALSSDCVVDASERAPGTAVEGCSSPPAEDKCG